jgi:hypothetical protein
MTLIKQLKFSIYRSQTQRTTATTTNFPSCVLNSTPSSSNSNNKTGSATNPAKFPREPKHRQTRLFAGEVDAADGRVASALGNNRKMDMSSETLPLSFSPLHQQQQESLLQREDASQQGNRRWLILMEPINALFASVILGEKVLLKEKKGFWFI